MSLIFKEGVSIRGIRPETTIAITSALSVFDKNHLGDLMITAGTDGVHMQGSLHYKGLAFDLRVHNQPATPQRMFQALKEALEPIGCIVLYEDPEPNPNAHIHVQILKGVDWKDLPEISGPNVHG